MSDAVKKSAPDTTEQERVDNYRHRQVSVARVLDELFSKPAKNKPELWGQRAYLMVVGLIYERLATGERDISTEDLTSLAKLLAEQRKALPGKTRGKAGTQAARAPGSKGLPKSFGEMVDQVYGTPNASDDALSKKNECLA